MIYASWMAQCDFCDKNTVDTMCYTRKQVMNVVQSNGWKRIGKKLKCDDCLRNEKLETGDE